MVISKLTICDNKCALFTVFLLMRHWEKSNKRSTNQIIDISKIIAFCLKIIRLSRLCGRDSPKLKLRLSSKTQFWQGHQGIELGGGGVRRRVVLKKSKKILAFPRAILFLCGAINLSVVTHAKELLTIHSLEWTQNFWLDDLRRFFWYIHKN